MKNQTYTSANTSINSSRLPVIYRKVPFADGDIVIDYGCGRYTDHLAGCLKGYGASFHGFDPFNQPEAVNSETLSLTHCDYVLCSNVLNVIDSDAVIADILKNIEAMHPVKGCVITVYEGNGTGTGKPTKNDCYQRNEKLSAYVDMLTKWGYNVSTSKGAMWVRF